MTDELYQELARRLRAAWMSTQAGHAGVDYVLKRYVPERVGEPWISLAEEVMRAALANAEVSGWSGDAPGRKP
jgi:hypothetical protein